MRSTVARTLAARALGMYSRTRSWISCGSRISPSARTCSIALPSVMSTGGTFPAACQRHRRRLYSMVPRSSTSRRSVWFATPRVTPMCAAAMAMLTPSAPRT